MTIHSLRILALISFFLAAPRVITPEDYIARSGPFLEGQGFFERETARRAEQFGHIAHVFSTRQWSVVSCS